MGYFSMLIFILSAKAADIDLSAAFADKMKINIEKYPIEKTSGSHKKYNELA